MNVLYDIVVFHHFWLAWLFSEKTFCLVLFGKRSCFGDFPLQICDVLLRFFNFLVQNRDVFTSGCNFRICLVIELLKFNDLFCKSAFLFLKTGLVSGHLLNFLFDFIDFALKLLALISSSLSFLNNVSVNLTELFPLNSQFLIVSLNKGKLYQCNFWVRFWAFRFRFVFGRVRCGEYFHQQLNLQFRACFIAWSL